MLHGVCSPPRYYQLWLNHDHLFFLFSLPQSVKSIEERTRPNLCKTLKGNRKWYSSHSQSVRCDLRPVTCDLPIIRGDTYVMCFFLWCRAGLVRWAGTSCGRCHYTPDGSLQAEFHRLNFQYNRQHGSPIDCICLQTGCCITGLQWCCSSTFVMICKWVWTHLWNRIDYCMNLKSTNSIGVFFVFVMLFTSLCICPVLTYIVAIYP